MTSADPMLDEIARFAASTQYTDLPEDVVEVTRLHLLDAIGLMHQGRNSEYGRIMTAAFVGSTDNALDPFPHWSLPPEDSGSPVPPVQAFAPLDFAPHAAWIHVSEFDDTHLASVVHPSCVIVPTLMCVARQVPVPAERIITAAAIGTEVLIRLGLEVQRLRHLGQELRLSGTMALGACATAATAGHLLGLDEDRMREALALAANMMSGGLSFIDHGGWCNNESPGLTATTGVIAAVTAAHGVTGPAKVFSGRFGVFSLMIGVTCEPVPMGTLGTQWHSSDQTFKFIPGCHYLHAPIFLLQRGAQELGLTRYEDLQTLTVAISDHGRRFVSQAWEKKLRPDNAYEGFFSMPDMLGRAWGAIAGGGDLSDAILTPMFGGTDHDRVEATRIAEKLIVADAPQLTGFAAEVSITTHDGRTWSGALDEPRPLTSTLTDEQLVVAKFHANMRRGGVEPARAEEWAERLLPHLIATS